MWNTSQQSLYSMTLCESCKPFYFIYRYMIPKKLRQASFRNEDCRTRTWNDKRQTFHLCIRFTHVEFSIQNQQSHYCYPMSLCDSVFKGNYHYKIGKRFYCNTFPKHWISAHFLNNILPHDESFPEQNKWKNCQGVWAHCQWMSGDKRRTRLCNTPCDCAQGWLTG